MLPCTWGIFVTYCLCPKKGWQSPPNLKNLNQHIPYVHFKMDSIFSALELITQDCWMGSLDLKDAYYSVKIHPDFQKYLRFCYNNKIYQYTAYPNGLSS